MKMLDLFSGIGGFSLAAEWCWGDELEIKGFVEIDKYCQKVLKKHWPDVQIWTDVKTFGYDSLWYSMDKKVEIDLITGGFPCQDISIAGKGVGIEGERSGLWSEFRRIIGEIRPRFALIENVPMLIHRGLGRVLSDLAEIGYDAEWQSISAAEVGAWHKRERIWIVAYPNRTGDRTSECRINGNGEKEMRRDKSFLEPCRCGEIPYPNNSGLHRETVNSTETRVNAQCRVGGCSWWATEPDVGRVAHGIPNRVDRLKGLGNSIVPQVAYIIMQQIKNKLDIND